MTATVVSLDLLESLEEQFMRNHIAGRWQFPAAPYEFEIRSPADSRIVAVVPLSSRFDVSDAVESARSALRTGWGERATRTRAVRHLVDELAVHETDLAALQCAETGLLYEDSLAAVRFTLSEARAMLRCESVAHLPETGGVSGHILSWGLPFNEVISSVLPALLAGDTVVVKPSLRAPLSASALVHFADLAGFAPGVVNIVQGTGGDVGAELVSRRDLSGLHVRANDRVVKQASRSRTGVPLRTLRAGGNAIVVGAEAGEALHAVVGAAVDMIRVNSAGGPLALGTLAVHSSLRDTAIASLVERLHDGDPAPLPTEALRMQALRAVAAQVGAGARPQLGGVEVPDDIAHRMGWRMLPTILDLGKAGSDAHRMHQAVEPLGPVVSVFTFDDPVDLASAFSAPRYSDGVARLAGFGSRFGGSLPHGLTVGEPFAGGFDSTTRMAPSWFGRFQ